MRYVYEGRLGKDRKMKAFAVGWVRIGEKDFPEPTGVNTTWAIFVSRNNAEKFAKANGGCKIRPCEVSLKFSRCDTSTKEG